LSGGVAEAAPRGHVEHARAAHGRVEHRPYYASHGVRFAGGYYYRGREHHHWGYQVWNAQFRRYHFWDNDLRCFYYYSPERDCYLPVG
jgi:hypothetical protein